MMNKVKDMSYLTWIYTFKNWGFRNFCVHINIFFTKVKKNSFCNLCYIFPVSDNLLLQKKFKKDFK